MCSKAILCAKIAQKYKHSKRQKLLRSCRAQPGPAYWRSPQYLPAMRTFSQVAILHPRIWSKTLLHPPVWHNISTAWIERHVQYFLRAKRLDLQATKKKKKKETGNGQNFWIASLNANLLHQSKNNKDILSFLLEMPSFLEKKKVSMPFSKALLISEKCRGRPGNRIDIDADNGWELTYADYNQFKPVIKKNTNEKKILVELIQIYEAASIFKWNEHF